MQLTRFQKFNHIIIYLLFSLGIGNTTTRADIEVIAVDGVSFGYFSADILSNIPQSVVNLFYKSRTSSYLEDNLNEIVTKYGLNNVRITPFLWDGSPGNPFGSDANETVSDIQSLVDLIDSKAANGQNQVVIIAHSWGTFLTYYALTQTTYEPDLVVFLSSPLGSSNAHFGDPFPIGGEKLVVDFTNAYSNFVESRLTGIAKAKRFINFWAWRDVISGPITEEISAQSTLNYQVDRYTTDALGYRSEDRVSRNSIWEVGGWHSYTGLEIDHGLGRAMVDDIGYLLGFISGEVAQLDVVSPSMGDLVSNRFDLSIFQPTELNLSSQLISVNGLTVFSDSSISSSPITVPIDIGNSVYEVDIDIVWTDKFLNDFTKSITVYNEDYVPTDGDWIGLLEAYPNPATQGGLFALIAQNIVHPEDRRIESVHFYQDSNGSGNLELEDDTFLGLGHEFQGDWVLDFFSDFSQGDYRFFSIAFDEFGNSSDPISTVASFVFAPATEGSDFDLRNRDWQDDRGDDDGVLEGFEEVTLDIRLENESSSVIYDVSASISSTYGSQLAITDGTVEFSTFDPGETQWDRGDFEMQLNRASANDIEFTVRVTYTKDDRRYYQDFTFNRDFYAQGSRAADFEIASYTIDDSTLYRVGNNGDGIFDSGEKVRLRPNLRNSGNADATDVDLYLTWAGSGVDPFSDGEPYGSINDGQTKSLAADDYFSVRSDRAYAGTVAVDMEVRWDENQTPLLIPDGFSLEVNGVGWLDAEWSDGSEDTNFGVISPGTILQEGLKVWNRGGGDLTISAIESLSPDLSISGVTFPFVIPPGEFSMVPVSFDSTGLNQTVVRELRIVSDGRRIENSSLSGELTVILTGTVTEISSSEFEILQSYFTGNSSFSPHLIASAVANLDGDEFLDLVVFDGDVPETEGNIPTLTIYEEDGIGNLVERWNSGGLFPETFIPWDVSPLAVADFNGDGLDEIVVAIYSTDPNARSGSNGVLHVLASSGVDQWSSVYSGYANHGSLLDVVTGDWDKDGRSEIVLTTSVGGGTGNPVRGRLYVVEGDSSFRFSQIYSISDISDGDDDYLAGFSGITIADSDKDGFNELIFASGHPETRGRASNAGDQLFIYESTGNNSFTKRYSGMRYDSDQFGDIWDFAEIAVGDPDQDGKNELILADEGSRDLWIWEITGNNTWASDLNDASYEYRDSSFAQEAYSLKVGNVDRDQNIEILLGTDNSASPNAFIIESFAADSYLTEWSTSIAGDNPISVSITDSSQIGSPAVFWGVTTEGLFVVGQGSTSASDLVIFSSGISLGQNAVEKEASTLYAKVSNPLSNSTPAFDVSFYIGDPESIGTLIATETVGDGIEGNSSVDVSVPWTPLEEGPADIFVVLDESDLVSEFDETNNQASRTFIIEDSDLSGPTLVSFAVEELNGDGDGIIGSDESIKVSWELDDPSGISEITLWLGDTEISTVLGNEATIDPLAADSYVLTLRASDDDVSPESSQFHKDFSVVTAENMQISVNGKTLPPGTSEARDLGVANIGVVFNATLRIENTGEQSLVLKSIDVDPSFGAIDENNIIVGPGGSQIFRLELDSSVGGVTLGSFVIVDEEDTTTSIPLTFTINAPPTIGVIGDQSLDEESVFDYQVSVSDDGLSGSPIEFGLVNNPNGMSIDNTGRIEWTPSEHQGPNDYTVLVQVTDGMDTDVSEFNITVSEVNEAPELSTIGDKTVDQLSELTFNARATDPDVPVQDLVFSLQGAPTGAIIDSETGEFSWTPSSEQGEGSYDLLVRVSDGIETVFEEISILVETSGENTPPILSPIGPQSIQQLFELTFTAEATDLDTPSQTLTYSLVGAPDGAIIDSESGEFSWTPSDQQGEGVYTVTIRVTDGEASDEEEITITVTSPPDTPFEQIAELPVRFSGSTMSAVDGSLYIFGGLVDGASSGSTKIYQLDPAADTPALVESSAALPYGMGWGLSSATASNDKIYLGPARGPSSGGGWGSRSKIVEFDPASPSASELSIGYPGNTWDVSAASDVQGDVYFFGGHTGGDIRSIYRLDGSGTTFESAGQLPWGENALYAVSKGVGEIYLISYKQSKVALYDPQTEEVTILADIPAEHVVASSANLAWVDEDGNCFFIMRERETEVMWLFKYNTASSTVEKLDYSIPASVKEGVTTRVGDYVYLLGGDESGEDKSYLYRIHSPVLSIGWKPEIGDADITNVGVTTGAGPTEGSTSWEFDGSSYLTGPADHEIFGQNPPLGHTVLLAFKTTADQGYLFSAYDSEGYDGFSPLWIFFANGSLQVGGRYTSGSHIGWTINQDAESTLNDGAWHTVAVVLDQAGGNATLYIDGQPVGTDELSVTADYTDGGTIRFGSTRFQGLLPHEPFSGSLSDFEVRASLLSASEIAAWSESVVPTTDLLEVVRYDFENSLEDSVGERDGTSEGGAVQYVQGPGGGMALQMPNIPNHRIAVPVYPFASDSFVVAAWIKMDDEDAWFTNTLGNRSQANVLTYQTGDFAQGFILGLGPSTETLSDRLYSTYDPGSINNGQLRVDLDDLYGRWIHVASVVNVETNVRQLYVNGELVGETPITSATFAAAEGFIGAYKYSSARNGNPQHVSSGIKIDDLRIFTGAADADDIKDIAGRELLQKHRHSLPFSEDWETGSIDPEVWHAWGSPASVLQTGGNVRGSYSFDNNGDSTWHSGVTTRETFQIVPGLRVSGMFYTENRGSPYDQSSNTMSLDSRELAFFTGSGSGISTDPLLPSIQQRANGTVNVGDNPAGVPLGAIAPNDSWQEFAFQFNADGSVSYLMNGNVIHTSVAGWVNYETIGSARLVLHGRSTGVVNLIDGVEVRMADALPPLPVIETQPVAQTMAVGGSISLSVTATGSDLTYQWRKGGVDIEGATGSTYTITTAAKADDASYSVVVTNPAGSITSSEVEVRVLEPVSITTQPTSKTVSIGQSATFSVVVAGDPEITYQWSKDGSPINGANSASLTTSNAQAADAGDYTVTIDNPVSSVTSATASLVVVTEPPVVSVDLQFAGSGYFGSSAGSATAVITMSYPGETLTSLGANFTLPPGWSYASVDGDDAPPVTPTPGATNAAEFAYLTPPTSSASFNVTLDYPAGMTGDQTLEVLVIYSASGGSGQASVSASAVLQQGQAPAITTQPQDTLSITGDAASFDVVATGTPPLSYTWSKGGTPIADATGASLALDALKLEDVGNYSVTVTNDIGEITSSSASLSLVDISATHRVDGSGYQPGGVVKIANTITYSGVHTPTGIQPITTLGMSVLLPNDVGEESWSFNSASGDQGQVPPGTDATELIEWAWTSVLPSPIEFSYNLNVPEGQTEIAAVSALITPVYNGMQPQALVLPDPLQIEESAGEHSADTDLDFRFSLSELLRVIEIYNYREGTVRTGEYTRDTNSVDGFTPGPDGDLPPPHHSADTDINGRFSLSELLRVIELYNYREGTVRTGEYHVDPSTVDGFAPGPEPQG